MASTRKAYGNPVFPDPEETLVWVLLINRAHVRMGIRLYHPLTGDEVLPWTLLKHTGDKPIQWQLYHDQEVIRDWRVQHARRALREFMEQLHAWGRLGNDLLAAWGAGRFDVSYPDAASEPERWLLPLMDFDYFVIKVKSVISLDGKALIDEDLRRLTRSISDVAHLFAENTLKRQLTVDLHRRIAEAALNSQPKNGGNP